MFARSCALVALLGACTDGPPSTAMFAVATAGDDFYALPYPNDLHRHEDGSLDLSLFPTNSLLVEDYRKAAESLDGFGLNAAIFARFDGALDPMSLPDPAASMTAAASVYLVNVDERSPNVGMRTPVIAHFRPDGTQTIGKNRLVVRPYPGFGLDEGTTYAMVVTNRVHGADGTSVLPAADWTALAGTGGDAAIVRARTVYARLFAWLDQPGDDERADVVAAAIFTTQHATYMGPAIRKAVYATPAPVALSVAMDLVSTNYTIWYGTYEAPNLQTGDPPYLSSGGEIQIGSDGAAVVQRMEPMRFALTIPLGTMPANGWPLCIYSHGTGGDYRSFIDDLTGDRLALQGIATISTDQVLHGPRNPTTDPSISFFNFGNPLSARDNSLQGAADAWSQQRLGIGLDFPDAASRPVKFDPTKISFFGHSQGGLTGPAYIAFEPALSGAVLSGTGGMLYLSMLYKTAPLDFPNLIETLTRDTPMDEDNPSIALSQMWIERADGVNYARFMVREPQLAPDGSPLKPRNIFQTEGFTDTYAPNPAIEAFATALGPDQIMMADEKDVLGLTLRGRSAKAAPISNNDNGATSVLAQYKQAAGSNGHFVVFDIPSARKQSAQFLGTLASTGKATVVAP
jgi:predicted esterase